MVQPIKGGMTSKVSIMEMEMEQIKQNCGWCPQAEKLLKLAGLFKIIVSLILILTGSATLIVYQGKPPDLEMAILTVNNQTQTKMDTMVMTESRGLIFQERQWTREHMGGILIFGIFFATISLIMSVILMTAAVRKIKRLLYIWPVWTFVYLVVGWTSALFIFRVNWLIILVLCESTQFQIFTIILIFLMDREIKTCETKVGE